MKSVYDQCLSRKHTSFPSTCPFCKTIVELLKNIHIFYRNFGKSCKFQYGILQKLLKSDKLFSRLSIMGESSILTVKIQKYDLEGGDIKEIRVEIGDLISGRKDTPYSKNNKSKSDQQYCYGKNDLYNKTISSSSSSAHRLHTSTSVL